MPSTGLGVYASAFLETALAAGFRADAFLAPAFFATGFFAVFLATFFFAMRGSLPQRSRFGQFTIVLGQVASQTRPEGASNARRTWVYVERCWRPRTKYGEANWPSTSADARAAIGPAREKSARLSGCLASRILLDHLLPGRARPRRVPHGTLAQADLEQRLRDLRGLRVVVDRLLELHDRLLVVALPVEGLADPVLGGRGLRVIGELRDELRELEGGLAIFPRAELGEGRREHAIRVGIAERRRGWRERRARGRRRRQHGRRRLRQGRGRRRGRRGHRSRALDGLHGETRVVDGGLELGELLAEALELGHEKSLLGIEGV